jgi:glutamate dehydrogenase/leucine dehydrogenase
VYPVTAVGWMIAVVTMIVGISAFAVVTAKIAEFLGASRRRGASGRRRCVVERTGVAATRHGAPERAICATR